MKHTKVASQEYLRSMDNNNMILPTEFYENPTTEQIEENIEFIDWSIMPLNLITEDIKEKFSGVRILAAIIWLQDILNFYEVKRDEESFPNTAFYFKDNRCCIEFDRKTIKLDYRTILLFMKTTFGIDLKEEAVPIIKNIARHHFGLSNIGFDVLVGNRPTEIAYHFLGFWKEIMNE